MNPIDSAISFVNPVRGLQRQQARAAMSAYKGAQTSRLRRNHSHNGARHGTEEDNLRPYDRMGLILEGQDLYRNNEIVHGAVNRFASYAVFKGIHPTANSSSSDWNAEAEAFWDTYAASCDYRQRGDLYEFQRLAIQARPIYGECFFIRLDNGQLMPVEASRVGTPQEYRDEKTVRDGIRLSKQGIFLGAYVFDQIYGAVGWSEKRSYKYIRRENIFHLANPYRFAQVRGMPDLAPVIAKLRDYDETDEGVVNKIKFEGRNLMKRTLKGGGFANANFRGVEEKESDEPFREEVPDGVIYNLTSDEDVASILGATPNAQVVPFLEHELRSIAACLNVPYEYLMLIFTQGSFSAQKAALMHANHTFEEWHDWLVKKFLSPLWNWRIAMAMQRGEISRAPVDKYGRSEWRLVDWSVPWPNDLDLDKQMKGLKGELDIGSTSITEICKRKNRRREKIWDDIEKEYDDAAARVARHNAKHPAAPIGIDHFTHSAQPGAVNQPAQVAAQEETEE